MSEERKFVSIDPDDAVAGGLLNDVNVVWQAVKAASYDYNGKVVPAGPALEIALVDEETGEEYGQQYYAAGRSDAMAPSEDGKGFLPLKAGVGGLNNKSRMYQLMQSLRNAGFPKEKMGEVQQDLTKLGGLVCHMVQEPALGKRQQARKRADGSEYEDTVLVVESIKKMPWEAAAAGGKAAGAGAGKKAAGAGKKAADKAADAAPSGAEASDSGDADTKAQTMVMELLAERGGEVMKKDLPTEAFKRLKDDPDRATIVKLVFDDKWLGADKPWSFEDGCVKM